MKKIIYLIIAVVAITIIAFILLRATPTQQLAEIETKEEYKSLPVSEQDYIQSLVRGLRSGGVPKDGIPAIDDPKYTTATEADEWLEPEDVVFGVVRNGEAYAFPQRILVWHEIANINIGGVDLVVSYCPLTGTAIGFIPPEDSKNKSFGVSGKLVNSNLTMYDRETDSYYPQILGSAILGDSFGNQLEEFHVIWTTWRLWKNEWNTTKVLSRETGFFRNYGVSGDPYGSYIEEDSRYYSNDQIIYAPINSDDRLPPKTVVVGVRDQSGNAIAVPKDLLKTRKSITAPLGDREVHIVYLKETESHVAQYTDTNEWINSIDSMWFPWASYYPDTQLID